MATQPDARTALATRRQAQQGDGPPPLPARIEALQNTFALALPRGLEAVRFTRDALTCLRTIRDLDKCDPESVLGALMTCAQLGLRPGVLGHAWPLPYWDGRTQGHRAQLIIGYQGYIELGHRSGEIADIIARTVYERDTFDVDYGLANNLIHKPELRVDPGPAIAYYAIVRYRNGGHAFMVMPRWKVEAHRDRYAPRNKQQKIVGPWADAGSFDAMAMKTCIRQLAKFMPKSTDLLAEAIAADGGLRVDLNPQAPASDVTGMAPMWDGQVVADEQTTEPDQPPAETRPARADGRTRAGKLLQKLHIVRNKLEGFAGTSDEARELFMVHLASVLGREVASTKDLTEAELETAIADLERALADQQAREQQRSGASDLTIAQVATEQAEALRTVTHADPGATEEGFPY